MSVRSAVLCRLCAVAVLAAAPFARAADAPTPLTPAQESAFLKPYVTEDTFMVTHVDAAFIDTAAMEKFIGDTLATVAADDPTLPEHVGQARLIADAFLGRFKKLGGRHAYILLFQKGDHEPQPPIVLFPVEAGGDVKGLTALLSTFPGMQSVQLSDSLVGLSALPRGMTETAPADRPDLDQALAHGSGALQIAIVLGQSSRDTLAAKAPNFPPTFGGGSTDILSKHFQYGMVSLTPPPNPEVHFVIESDSPENAKATLDLINSYFSFAAHSGGPADFGSIMAPEVKGNGVEMNLDSKKIQSAAGTIIPSLFAARNRARAVASAANIRQDLMGAMMYAADNNDDWPKDLQTLQDKGYIQNNRGLTNPGDPKHRPYEYHPFTKEEMKKLDSAFTPVIWEQTDDETVSLNVGYLDGHVEKLSSKAELTKQLDDVKNKLKAP